MINLLFVTFNGKIISTRNVIQFTENDIFQSIWEYSFGKERVLNAESI